MHRIAKISLETGPGASGAQVQLGSVSRQHGAIEALPKPLCNEHPRPTQDHRSLAPVRRHARRAALVSLTYHHPQRSRTTTHSSAHLKSREVGHSASPGSPSIPQVPCCGPHCGWCARARAARRSLAPRSEARSDVRSSKRGSVWERPTLLRAGDFTSCACDGETRNVEAHAREGLRGRLRGWGRAVLTLAEEDRARVFCSKRGVATHHGCSEREKGEGE